VHGVPLGALSVLILGTTDRWIVMW